MVNLRNLSKLADRAKSLAGQHNAKIDQAIDKGVQAADKATKGKYGDKLTTNADKLKGAVDRVADKPTAPGGTAGTGPGSSSVADAPAPAPPPAAADAPVQDPDAPKGTR